MKARLFDTLTFAYLLAVAVLVFWHPEEDQLLALLQSPLTGFGLPFLFLGVALVLALLAKSREVQTLGASVFAAPQKRGEATITPWLRRFATWHLLVLFAVTLAVGLHITEFSLRELLDADGLGGAQRLLLALASPNWAVLPEAILAVVQTIYMAFIATVLALPFAFVLSFLAAKNVMGNKPLGFLTYSTLRLLLNLLRSIEALVWAIIFGVWVGIGPFAGMLALFVHSVASLAKQYSEIVECADQGPIEGISSTGASALQVIWFGLVPQVLLPYTSFTIYRWDINVRMATIIGLVGGGGIGRLLNQYQGQAMWQEVGCIVVVIAIVVWLMDTASAYLREAIK